MTQSEVVRVAIVTESFLPNVNGVTNSVLRVLEYARRHGHECLVIAPSSNVGILRGAKEAVRANPFVSALGPVFGSGRQQFPEFDRHLGFPVHRVTTMRVPRVDSLPVAAPSPSVYKALKSFDPDVVHLASPFSLGAAGAAAAKALDVPCVAVYQTDVASYTESYGVPFLEQSAWRLTRRLHALCARTLAPSTASMEALAEQRIPRLYRWGRGVDADRFHPRARSEPQHRIWSPDGRPVVGFVGRLAVEKHIERLAPLAERSGPDGDLQLVIVGDGPERPALQKLMPNAIFTGELHGDALATAYATLDVFCHPGEFETFCQAIQEAHASGVPVVGPNRGGPRDLVTDDVNGFLLEVSEYESQVSDTVDRILAEHERFAEAGRRTIKGRTWSALCEQLFDHYLAAGARPRGGQRTVGVPAHVA